MTSWSPKFKLFQVVRVTSNEKADFGGRAGARGTVVDIYGPEVPPATIEHPSTGYGVQLVEVHDQDLTLGFREDELEAVTDALACEELGISDPSPHHVIGEERDPGIAAEQVVARVLQAVGGRMRLESEELWFVRREDLRYESRGRVVVPRSAIFRADNLERWAQLIDGVPSGVNVYVMDAVPAGPRVVALQLGGRTRGRADSQFAVNVVEEHGPITILEDVGS